MPVAKQFGKARKAIGLPKDIVLYSARHTFATDMLDTTGNLSLVQKMLGHDSITTTQPSLTDAQLQEAHAYAYGGSAIQDLGYYPFGNAFFSELTHYVRSGDFVLSLLRNARTPDDLAFAIGSLAHYIGDNIGHRYAVNHAVPIEFPKLQQRYGAVVNYAENPHAHVQTEFAFDINQLSKRRFAPYSYLEYVGLEIPRPLLRTAFYETYGLNLSDIIGTKENSLRIYRYGVRRFLPNIAADGDTLGRRVGTRRDLLPEVACHE